MTQSEIYIFCGTTATSHFPLSLTVPWTKRNPHGGLSAEEGTRLPWPACAHNSSRIWPSQPGPAPSIIVVAPAMMMMMEGGKPTRPRSSPDLRGGREGGGSRRTIGRVLRLTPAGRKGHCRSSCVDPPHKGSPPAVDGAIVRHEHSDSSVCLELEREAVAVTKASPRMTTF